MPEILKGFDYIWATIWIWIYSNKACVFPLRTPPLTFDLLLLYVDILDSIKILLVYRQLQITLPNFISE